MLIPFDVAFAPTLLDAIRVWKDPKFAQIGAPYPGPETAARLWYEAAPLRDAE